MARVTRTTKVSVGDISKETVKVVDDFPTFIFMYQVESSNVGFVGHNENSMFVKYKTGDLYRFEQVDKKQFDVILKCGSVGKAIHALGIKGTKM